MYEEFSLAGALGTPAFASFLPWFLAGSLFKDVLQQLSTIQSQMLKQYVCPYTGKFSNE